MCGGLVVDRLKLLLWQETFWMKTHRPTSPTGLDQEVDFFSFLWFNCLFESLDMWLFLSCLLEILNYMNMQRSIRLDSCILIVFHDQLKRRLLNQSFCRCKQTLTKRNRMEIKSQLTDLIYPKNEKTTKTAPLLPLSIYSTTCYLHACVLWPNNTKPGPVPRKSAQLTSVNIKSIDKLAKYM